MQGFESENHPRLELYPEKDWKSAQFAQQRYDMCKPRGTKLTCAAAFWAHCNFWMVFKSIFM